MRLENLPTILSMARLLAGPLLLFLFSLKFSWSLITLIFIFASLTDALDGWIARRFQLCSPVGAWIDHLADKVLMTTVCFLLSWKYAFLFIQIFLVLTVWRELIALAARSYPLDGRVGGENFQVSLMGKAKTILQSLAFTCLLFETELDSLMGLIGIVLLVGSVLCAMSSLYFYMSFLIRKP